MKYFFDLKYFNVQWVSWDMCMCMSNSVVSDSLQVHGLQPDCNLPGSSVHGILQVRILKWVAIIFSGGSS